MQIVIDIPKEIYNLSRIAMIHPGIMTNIPLAVIFDGIPLPESHGDLIDRNELLRKLEAWDKGANGIPNYAWNRIRDAKVVLEGTK